jgi:hypothetical protein
MRLSTVACLPRALCARLKYDDLEISDANSASLAYSEIQNVGATVERIAELRDALLA